MKYGITLYAVPELSKVSGGPRTRISKISEILSSDITSHIVTGNYFSKIKLTFKAPSGNILYVESSTNRLKIIDVICLLILKIKSRKTVTYIRDVYIQVFPNQYSSLRNKLTKFGNKYSNLFYVLISHKLAFPTIEMGEVFFKNRKLKRSFFCLPPGAYEVSRPINSSKKSLIPEKRKLNLLYLGGTQYVHSGFEQYLNIASKMKYEHNFYVFSGDEINDLILKYDLKDSLVHYSLSHKEVLKFINDLNIDFVIHARPRNKYDDITYPIKVMDCISLGLPIITLKHKPIVSLLSKDYPFYINELSLENISYFIDEYFQNELQLYNKAIKILHDVKQNTLYSMQIDKIIKNAI